MSPAHKSDLKTKFLQQNTLHPRSANTNKIEVCTRVLAALVVGIPPRWLILVQLIEDILASNWKSNQSNQTMAEELNTHLTIEASEYDGQELAPTSCECYLPTPLWPSGIVPLTATQSGPQLYLPAKARLVQVSEKIIGRRDIPPNSIPSSRRVQGELVLPLP